MFTSFIHNCQNLEVIKMSFGRQMDKLWNTRYQNIMQHEKEVSHQDI